MGKKDSNVRMSLQTLRVLEVFLEYPSEQLAGAEVHQRCGIASGTLYPILIRLESAGWFVSQWESIDPSSAGRPRRRLYRLTSTGAAYTIRATPTRAHTGSVNGITNVKREGPNVRKKL